MNWKFILFLFPYFKGEEIMLTEAISTAKARGQVEKWLLELETSMKRSIRGEILNSNEAYLNEEILEWVLKWPGQCVRVTSFSSYLLEHYHNNFMITAKFNFAIHSERIYSLINLIHACTL